MRKKLICSSNYFIKNCVDKLKEYYDIVYLSDIAQQACYVSKIEADKVFNIVNKLSTGLLHNYKDIFTNIIIIDTLLSNTNFDGCVLNEHYGPIEKAIITKLNSQNKPTVLIPIGIPDSITDRLVYTGAGVADISDVLCTSEFHAKLYDKSKVHLTGHPYFDNYPVQRIKNKRPTVIVSFEIDYLKSKDLNTLVLCVQQVDAGKDYFKMFGVASKLKDFDFIIKLKFGSYLTPNHFNISVNNIKVVSGNYHDWVGGADVSVSSATSFASLEAIYHGIPVVVPKFDTQVWDYKGATVSEIEWELDIIKDTIMSVLNKEQKNKEFNDYYFPFNQDGKATERCVEAIRKII